VKPLPELLDGPEVAGYAVVGRLAVFDDLEDLFYLSLGKRGARPSVLR
jgi:hypothetical protein